MAERKSTGRKAPQTGKKTPGRTAKNQPLPLAAIFWLVFFIVVTGLFLANRETIGKNFNLLTRRLGISTGVSPAPNEENKPEPRGAEDSGSQLTAAPENTGNPPAAPQTPASRTPETPPPEKSESPAQPSSGQPADAQPAARQPSAQPAAAPPENPPASPPASQTAVRPAETRERSIYLTQVEKDGTILRTKVIRTIAVSDSPMQDSLNVLLAGPTAAEQRQGLISLIPPNTRILAITVRGTTAYISFSEEFQYNTYGVEGYAAQLRQVVWTATEFSTVTDVQILIEGRRVDYLGEGIWIGSPVSRESL